MRHVKSIALVAAALTLSAALVALASDSAKKPVQQARTSQEMLDEINSMGGPLYELAWERHAADSKRQQKVILTTHDGMEILRFTDNNYTVVSLPAFLPRDTIALSHYTSHYNRITERLADLQALAGDYDDPLRTYRLLQHFAPPDRKQGFAEKISLVEKLKKGTGVEDAKRQLSELSCNLGTLMKLDKMNEVTPTVVTNLLELHLPLNDAQGR